MSNSLETQLINYLKYQRETGPAELNSAASWSGPVWRRGMSFLDSAGLTLYFRERLDLRQDLKRLPGFIQDRLAENLMDNTLRTRKLIEQFLEINRALQNKGIRYKSLKGLLLFPLFFRSPESRVQYDFDFLIHPEDLLLAQKLFFEMGYSPSHVFSPVAADHVPPLIKRGEWHWRGNYFDPEIPAGLELHYRLWDWETERIPILAFDNSIREDYWMEFKAMRIPALEPALALLYNVLHALRHLLRNDLRLSHLYEIGYFLEKTQHDSTFWDKYLGKIEGCRSSQSASALIFSLTGKIFDPKIHSAAESLIAESLSKAGTLWLDVFASKESIQGFRQSKSVVFLHLELVEDGHSRWVIWRRRLLPKHLPLMPYGIERLPSQLSLFSRLFNRIKYGGLLAVRTWFHGWSLVWFLIHWPQWKWQLARVASRQPLSRALTFDRKETS